MPIGRVKSEDVERKDTIVVYKRGGKEGKVRSFAGDT
jgi:hypothetical protein